MHTWQVETERGWRFGPERGTGQEDAVWNRDTFPMGTLHGSDQLCAWCNDRPELPWAGAESLILIGGDWLHPDCAEQMAQAITPSPHAFPQSYEDRRARLAP